MEARMLLLRLSGYFCRREVWWMHGAGAHCTEGGQRGPKGREKSLCLHFSCLATKYEFYFTEASCVVIRRRGNSFESPTVLQSNFRSATS